MVRLIYTTLIGVDLTQYKILALKIAMLAREFRTYTMYVFTKRLLVAVLVHSTLHFFNSPLSNEMYSTAKKKKKKKNTKIYFS